MIGYFDIATLRKEDNKGSAGTSSDDSPARGANIRDRVRKEAFARFIIKRMDKNKDANFNWTRCPKSIETLSSAGTPTTTTS